MPTAGSKPAEDLSDLREMLREQERVIDHQVHALEEQDDQSEHMIRLGVAALAGAVALASLIIRGAASLPDGALILLGVGAVSNGAALILFVDAYVGFRRHPDAHIGPDPRWVAQRAADPTWTLEKHLTTLIEDHAGYAAHNHGVAARGSHRRRTGVYGLLVAFLGYAGGYIYILWGVM